MGDSKERAHLGKTRDDALFPVAPASSEMAKGYPAFIETIKGEIRNQRLRTVISANADMICLYWRIGKVVSERQAELGWGSRVADRMSADLHREFPDMSGFSVRNLKYMKKFAECWPDYELVQRCAALIPWRSNQLLLDKLDTVVERQWYAQKTAENGWSRDILSIQIKSHLMERSGAQLDNFKKTLPPVKSDMAIQVFKDPYLFDFLGTDSARREVEVERKLTEHIQEFLLELGQGFAFVGRQVHLEVGGDDFYLDLLFYHLKLRCFVVIELKAREFEPGFLGQLSMYQSAVDDLLRHEGDAPTIGLLLVKGKNKTVVEYSIEGYTKPIGVADWTADLEKNLPEDIKSSLPTIQEIEAQVEGIDAV